MNKVYHFINDTYNQEYYFCPAHSEQLFLRTVKQITKTQLEAIDLKENDGWTIQEKGIIFIWVKTRLKDSLAPLAHECTHAATYTLKSRGVRLDANNDEPWAYLIQWIYAQCLKNMKIKNG